jgi:hypothetical protein
LGADNVDNLQDGEATEVNKKSGAQQAARGCSSGIRNESEERQVDNPEIRIPAQEAIAIKENFLDDSENVPISDQDDGDYIQAMIQPFMDGDNAGHILGVLRLGF